VKWHDGYTVKLKQICNCRIDAFQRDAVFIERQTVKTRAIF
jgi:hypothetical protein